MSVLISLVTLVIGLLGGFYGRTVYDRLNTIYAVMIERREAKKVGIVRPTAQPVFSSEPIDLSSTDGAVTKRPTPAQVEAQRKVERDQVLHDNHV